jgi:signal transduction histidine kinase
MNPLPELFAHHMVLIYFLYGLAFFAMGLALAISGQRTSQFRFGQATRPLAAFGILHGIHEWIEMFQRLAAPPTPSGAGIAEEIVRVTILAASFLMLLAFAVHLLLSEGSGVRGVYQAIGVAGSVWLVSVGVAIMAYRATASEAVVLADVLARYTLGIPGALLGAWALMRQQRAFRERGMERFGRDLVWCTTALLMYGAVGQLFVRPAVLPPATLINSDLFIEWVGIPVQLFRGCMAAVLAVYMTRALSVFAVEDQRRLEEALAGERRIAEEMERLNDTLRLRTRELSLLLDVTNMLAALPTLEDGLRAALVRMIESLTFPSAGIICLADRAGPAPRVAAEVGFDTADEDTLYGPAVELSRMSITRGVIVCRHSDGVLYEFSLDDAKRRQECRCHPFPVTMISFPLIIQAMTIGSVALSWATSDRNALLPVDEYEIMVGVAQQLAVAVENARLRQQARERERLLENLLHQVVSAQETERQRIARELHDVTGQSLTAIALGLRGAETTVRINPNLAIEQIHQLGAYSATALSELRQLIADLRPSQLDDLGLVAALQWYLHEFEARSSLKVDFVSSGSKAQRLPAEHETTLFRIVQEALTNVARHAHASRVSVRVDADGDRLCLTVDDDGVGFDVVSSLSQRGTRGWGLVGIQERAALLGGECEITSWPGRGTRLVVTIPLPGPADRAD